MNARSEGAPPDMRLVPAAAAGWAVALCGLYLGWLAALLVGAFGASAAVVSRQCAVRRGSGRRRRWISLVLLTGAVTAAVSLVVGAHQWRVETHPVRAAADRGATVTAEVQVRDDPHPVHRQGGYERGSRPSEPAALVVPAALRAAELAGRSWQTGGRVVLLTPVEGWRDVLPGQRIRVRGLLAPPERSDLTVAAVRVRGEPERLSEPPVWQRAAGDVRSGLRSAAATLPPEQAGLLPALVVGDTTAMVPEVKEEFRAAGLTHLTAVSGTNVTIVCGAVLGVLLLVGAGPRAAAIGAAVALVGFVILARPQPSVLRAAVMGGVTLLALVAGRSRSAMPALATAVIVLLLVDPALGADPGFVLSVLATAGLVLLTPPWTAALRARRLPRGLAEAVAVAAAAQLVTAPVIVALSGEISLVAIAANLLATPVVPAATVLGVITAVLVPLHAGAAELVATAAGPAMWWLVTVAKQAAAVPGGVVSWPAGVVGGLLLAGLTMVVLVLLRARRLRVLAVAAALGVAVVVAPTRYVTPGWPASGWSVVACDVGQGDAMVLATADAEQAVLVDTGYDDTAVDRCLDRLGVRRLALIVLTHLHADHIGGLDGALRGREVGAVALGTGRAPQWAFRDVVRISRRAAVPLVQLTAGQRLMWPGLTIDVLAPDTISSAVDFDDDGTAVNNTSVVLRATSRTTTTLLTGDIELAAQARLLAGDENLRADVLKVPHHGSSYTNPEFLTAVRPRVALISVGADNDHGHPSEEVTDVLTRLGTHVVRTDLDGDLAVTGGGDDLAVVARDAGHHAARSPASPTSG